MKQAVLLIYSLAVRVLAQTHIAALTDSGKVYTWGAGSRGQIGDNSQTEKVSKPTYIPVNNTNVWGVAVGGTNTSAILTDGYVYTWGCK